MANLEQTTIKARGGLQQIKDNEVAHQRDIYLAAYDALAKDPTDANWKRATDEFQKLMDIKALYVEGKRSVVAVRVINKQRSQ
jgi:hypothetical protein